MGFRCGLTLGSGTPKIMASTGVFVRVVSALTRTISDFSRTPSMTLTYLKIGKATATKRWAQRDYYEGRRRTEET